MWALGVWVLLGAVCAGSAQLQFNVIKSVEQTICNKTVILPCIVTNLAQKNTKVMFVKWKLGKKEFFSFSGETEKSHTNENFSSAKLESLQNLKFGVASLTISKAQAVPGNYSCEVTESNREGETVIELVYRIVSWFTPIENSLIILFMVLAILFYWIQLVVTVSKFETALLKIGLFIAGVVITVFAIVGFSLLISGESVPNIQDSDDYPPSRSPSFCIVSELSANDSVSVTSCMSHSQRISITCSKKKKKSPSSRNNHL
ncbi:leukocyte surface antigen CD47 isoform X6 [Chelonoidis abingdonii]|uniref:leukocyte surface antigen CD47 isoform X6 n=1 Tax=Chelonoidis abingdonii TaxID=106734 RepID=UPI003F493833